MSEKYTKCIIFTGGIIADNSFIDNKELKNSFIICADSGYKYAANFGCIPQVVIGDFDSCKFEDVKAHKVITYPPEKDDTDFILCIKYALEHGYKNIKIYGAFGGRMDHTIANIQALGYILSQGANGELVGENDSIRLISPGEYLIKRVSKAYLSLFSYSDKCEGVTLQGVKYTLDNGVITSNFPIGISNEFEEDFAKITFKSGKMLIIISKK